MCTREQRFVTLMGDRERKREKEKERNKGQEREKTYRESVSCRRQLVFG